MIDDCLHIRLSDYFERRRATDADADAADTSDGEAADAPDAEPEDGEGG